MPPVVDPKDNHVMHLKEKNDYRISEKFDLLPPELQNLLQMNMAQHTQFLVGQVNPQLAAPPDLSPETIMAPAPEPNVAQ